MKQIMFLVCFFASLTVVNSPKNPFSLVINIFKKNPAPTQVSFNGKIDEGFSVVRELIKTNSLPMNSNPLDLPGTIIPVLLGQLNLTDVKLHGFDSIYSYDARAIYDDFFIYLKLQLTFKKLIIDAEYALKILFLESQGTLNASIDDFVYSASLHVDRRTLKLYMPNLEVTSIGSFRTVNLNLEGKNLVDSFLACVLYPVFLYMLPSIIKEQGKAIMGLQINEAAE